MSDTIFNTGDTIRYIDYVDGKKIYRSGYVSSSRLSVRQVECEYVVTCNSEWFMRYRNKNGLYAPILNFGELMSSQIIHSRALLTERV